MKAEYTQEGKNIYYKNPTEETIMAGTLVVLGTICCIAATNIEPGKLGTLATTGVWLMPKDTTEIRAGEKVYYDAENDIATATALVESETENAQNVVLGYAIAEAGADTLSVLIKLNG